MRALPQLLTLALLSSACSSTPRGSAPSAAREPPARGVAPLEALDADFYGASHALLIGVSDYTRGWRDLAGVPGDVESLESLLEDHGFQVETVLDPDAEALYAAFKRFVDEHGYVASNRLLFIFLGHGHSREKHAKGYLVPTDAPLPDEDEQLFLSRALNMQQIDSWAKQMEVRHALFIFDSCFAGTIFNTRSSGRVPRHIVDLTSKRVRQFLTAGGAGDPVPDDSVFTPLLIEALRGTGDVNGDGYITGSELGAHLHRVMAAYPTGQTPQSGKILDPELNQGDFVFKVPAAHEPIEARIDSVPEASTDAGEPEAPAAPDAGDASTLTLIDFSIGLVVSTNWTMSKGQPDVVPVHRIYLEVAGKPGLEAVPWHECRRVVLRPLGGGETEATVDLTGEREVKGKLAVPDTSALPRPAKPMTVYITVYKNGYRFSGVDESGNRRELKMGGLHELINPQPGNRDAVPRALVKVKKPQTRADRERERAHRIRGHVIMKSGRTIGFDRIGTYPDMSGDYIDFTEDPLDTDYSKTPRVRIRFKNLHRVVFGQEETIEKTYYFSGSKGDKHKPISCRFLAAEVSLADSVRVELWSKLFGSWPCEGKVNELNVIAETVKHKIPFSQIREITFENAARSFEADEKSLPGRFRYLGGQQVHFDHVAQYHDFSGRSIKLVSGTPGAEPPDATVVNIPLSDVASIRFSQRSDFEVMVGQKKYTCRWRQAEVALASGPSSFYVWAPPYEDQPAACGRPTQRLSFRTGSIERLDIDLNLLERLELRLE